MADILHDFPIRVPVERVYHAVSTPEGLDTWWTKQSTGEPREGAEFTLNFGPRYHWRATVTRALAPTAFELQLTHSDPDWTGTRVRFELEAKDGATQVRFSHTGWPTANEHWRISCYCWAMYLRILRRYLEHGEMVPYERRLDV